MKYRHVLGAFFGTPWAIRPEKLAEIQAVLLRRIEHGPAAFDDAHEDPPRPKADDKGYQVRGAAAVVPIHGTITPRPSVFDDWSGGTSAERIGRSVEAAAADPAVSEIVLDVDSPGGSAFGTPEAAAKILTPRRSKRITAVANHEIASGAYWLASQAHEIVVSPSAWVGSIGVVWPRVDATEFENETGIKTHVITATGSPHKAEMWPEVPFSDDARAWMQATVDGIMVDFLAAIARGRNLQAAAIERDFGGGRMVFASDAITARMADRVATLEEVIGQVNARRPSNRHRQIAAARARSGLPTA